MMKPKDQEKLLMGENKRLAKLADQAGDSDAAKIHWQLAQHHTEDFARMDKIKKPKGYTEKTKKRIEVLRAVEKRVGPTTKEVIAAEVRACNDEAIQKLWTEEELENDFTILNFLKKYMV